MALWHLYTFELKCEIYVARNVADATPFQHAAGALLGLDDGTSVRLDLRRAGHCGVCFFFLRCF